MQELDKKSHQTPYNHTKTNNIFLFDKTKCKTQKKFRFFIDHSSIHSLGLSRSFILLFFYFIFTFFHFSSLNVAALHSICLQLMVKLCTKHNSGQFQVYRLLFNEIGKTNENIVAYLIFSFGFSRPIFFLFYFLSSSFRFVHFGFLVERAWYGVFPILIIVICETWNWIELLFIAFHCPLSVVRIASFVHFPWKNL